MTAPAPGTAPRPDATPQPDTAAPLLGADDARTLARSLSDLLDAARSALPDRAAGSATVRTIDAHLGVPYLEAALVSAELPVWQHVSAHRGAAAYLALVSPEATWFGVATGFGMPRQHNELLGLLEHDATRGRETLASPEYLTLATGPERTEEVIGFGLVCTVAPSGAPVVLALRATQFHGPPMVSFEVLCANGRDGAALTDELIRLADQHDIVRGQMVSFGVSEHRGNQLVSFLPRPDLQPDDVVLADGVLDTIERHVVLSARRAERLRDTGIHLKRGLLLHGPPGTGKTHTVRYLMGRLADSTVVVLTGHGLQFIEQAAALARRLAPSVVVVEDVDLVAVDRSFSPSGNPLLFSLLDAMDGVAADADVTFVLTTNRAADLETALVQRPGRIDLAVEIPRPDADGRRRLFELYRGRAAVTAELTPAIVATEGATASAIKELMRRAVLAAIDADPDADPPLVTDDVLRTVLDDFSSERESLSRSLVGGTPLDPSDAPADLAGAVPGSIGAPVPTVGPTIRTALSRGWTTYRPR